MNTYPQGVDVPDPSGYEFPSIRMLAAKIEALTLSLIDDGVGYLMGAKANPLSLQAGGFRFIDCSGFVRWAIYHASLASGSACILPDGSVNQRNWCIETCFKESDVTSALEKDNAIRIAFLTPEGAVQAGMGANERHVLLVVNGETSESHGGVGPSHRVWGSQHWMNFCEVFVLTPPAVAGS